MRLGLALWVVVVGYVEGDDAVTISQLKERMGQLEVTISRLKEQATSDAKSITCEKELGAAEKKFADKLSLMNEEHAVTVRKLKSEMDSQLEISNGLKKGVEAELTQALDELLSKNQVIDNSAKTYEIQIQNLKASVQDAQGQHSASIESCEEESKTLQESHAKQILSLEDALKTQKESSSNSKSSLNTQVEDLKKKVGDLTLSSNTRDMVCESNAAKQLEESKFSCAKEIENLKSSSNSLVSSLENSLQVSKSASKLYGEKLKNAESDILLQKAQFENQFAKMKDEISVVNVLKERAGSQMKDLREFTNEQYDILKPKVLKVAREFKDTAGIVVQKISEQTKYAFERVQQATQEQMGKTPERMHSVREFARVLYAEAVPLVEKAQVAFQQKTQQVYSSAEPYLNKMKNSIQPYLDKLPVEQAQPHVSAFKSQCTKLNNKLSDVATVYWKIASEVFEKTHRKTVKQLRRVPQLESYAEDIVDATMYLLFIALLIMMVRPAFRFFIAVVSTVSYYSCCCCCCSRRKKSQSPPVTATKNHVTATTKNHVKGGGSLKKKGKSSLPGSVL